jgi:hypothetical protein
MPDSGRPLTEAETALLLQLLKLHTHDRDRLLMQSHRALARTLDDFGSFAIDVPSLTKRSDLVQIPYAEAQTQDSDGVPIWITLFIKNGILDEVDIVRADGLRLMRPLALDELDVFDPPTLKTSR